MGGNDALVTGSYAPGNPGICEHWGELGERADITYIPLPKGSMYLVAVMDWYSRKMLAWHLSNTLDADCRPGNEELCSEATRAFRGFTPRKNEN